MACESYDYPLYPKLTKEDFFRYASEFLNKKPESNYIYTNWNKEYSFILFADHFTGLARSKARFKKNMAPYDYWRQICDKEKFKGLNSEEIREALYKEKDFKECNNFRITVYMQAMNIIIHRYGLENPKVLDPSAGWGDRLGGCIALGLEYLGIDPNRDLEDGYRGIIEEYGDSSKQQVLISGFLEAEDIKDEYYDVVFTSPPFFDLEIYSEEETQSVKKHPRLHDWFSKFMLPYMEKAVAKLKLGGIVAIYLEGLSVPYMQKFITYMGEKGCAMDNTIIFKEGQNRRIMVFVKKFKSSELI